MHGEFCKEGDVRSERGRDLDDRPRGTARLWPVASCIEAVLEISAPKAQSKEPRCIDLHHPSRAQGTAPQEDPRPTLVRTHAETNAANPRRSNCRICTSASGTSAASPPSAASGPPTTPPAMPSSSSSTPPTSASATSPSCRAMIMRSRPEGSEVSGHDLFILVKSLGVEGREFSLTQTDGWNGVSVFSPHFRVLLALLCQVTSTLLDARPPTKIPNRRPAALPTLRVRPSALLRPLGLHHRRRPAPCPCQQARSRGFGRGRPHQGGPRAQGHRGGDQWPQIEGK